MHEDYKWNALKVKLYYNLSFEFNYRVLSGRENKIHLLEAKTLDELGTTPCPRDADLKNGSCWKRERDAPIKQNQGKACATKAQQDITVNIAINSRLQYARLHGKALYYAKPTLRVSLYFQILALFKSFRKKGTSYSNHTRVANN
jgi:hypothetical protein